MLIYHKLKEFKLIITKPIKTHDIYKKSERLKQIMMEMLVHVLQGTI
jgi:hypothetical protein